MRRALSFVTLLMITISAMGDDGKYKEYCREMKEKRYLTLSIPESE